MSVLSMLALLVAPLAIKPNKAEPVEAAELVALRRQVDELKDDVARLNVQWRRDQELIDLWRERALGAIPALRPAGPDFRPPQYAAAMQQAPAAVQHQAALAQQNAYPMQNQALAGAMGLLGAQNLIGAELQSCNCVPSRSQVWAANG